MISGSRLKSHHPSPRIKMVTHVSNLFAVKQGLLYFWIQSSDEPDGKKVKPFALGKEHLKVRFTLTSHHPFRSGSSTF